MFLFATIGGDELKMEGDTEANPENNPPIFGSQYSTLKLSLPTTNKRGADTVTNVPYLLYDKKQLTALDSYSLLLRSPMAMLHFRIDGIGVGLCDSIVLQVAGVPTTFIPSKDGTGESPDEGTANLIVPGSIDNTYTWKATTPTFPTSEEKTCKFVCTKKDGSTETFTFPLPKTEAGKTYNYQFNFEHEISLSNVTVNDWTSADVFDGHADPVRSL